MRKPPEAPISRLTGLGATVLMTSELEDRYTDLRFSPYGAAFLTDAIIVQRYVEMEGALKRLMAVVKVRASQKAGDYADPGWYRHPPGTNAFEWTGSLAEPARFAAEGGGALAAASKPGPDIEVQVRKPRGPMAH